MNVNEVDIRLIKPYEHNPRFNDDAVETQKRPPPQKKTKIYGRYLVTIEGEIFSMGIKGGIHIHRQKTRPNEHGYLRARIGDHDEYVHRIVAKCFVPNPHGYLEVNHLDGVKSNNTASNLEWCTRRENNKHAFRIGLRSCEEMRTMAKTPKFKNRRLCAEQVREVRKLIKNGISCSAIARKFDCSRGVIDGIHNLKTYLEDIYK